MKGHQIQGVVLEAHHLCLNACGSIAHDFADGAERGHEAFGFEGEANDPHQTALSNGWRCEASFDCRLGHGIEVH
jgi:hypothetical protein